MAFCGREQDERPDAEDRSDHQSEQLAATSLATRPRQLRHARRTLYEMRHTFATLALAAGAPIEWISKQMGHTSIRTTLKYYARFLPAADARAVAALDAFESGAPDQPVRIQYPRADATP